MLPCCFTCKWSKRDVTRAPDPIENNPLIEPIECQQHTFGVWLPSQHVCADLGDPCDDPDSGLSTFARQAHLESGYVYAWFQHSYRTKEHPHIPQYAPDYVKFA